MVPFSVARTPRDGVRVAKAKKNGGSAQHPGVWLISRTYPSGNVAWRGKWMDPDTGEYEWETLRGKDYPSKASRTRFTTSGCGTQSASTKSTTSASILEPIHSPSPVP